MTTDKSVLVHVCCAHCAAYTIDYWRGLGYAVSAYWYNPNIHPFLEHQHRLDAMRTLAAEMDGRLAKLREHLSAVEKLVPQAVAEGHQRLQTRIEQLLGGEFDAQRLAQEAAVLADRANINEECERLAVHIESFQAALSAGGQVAKRMNFLLQEMHREVNTMGSKTNLMDITQLVIAMKEEVESMREQIQNLE